MPYYKWAFQRLKELSLGGQELAGKLKNFLGMSAYDSSMRTARKSAVDEICLILTGILRAQNLSDSRDTFLAAHGEQVQSSIQDAFLRAMSPYMD